MTPESGRPWVRRVRPEAQLRLFCFSHAGGGSADYRGWAPSFPGTVDVCPVVLPGREGRMGEAAHRDMPSLISALLPALWPLMRRTPFAFYGHSMGSWVAYELARALRARRREGPEHLFLGARRAPHLPSPHPALSSLPEDAFIEGVQRRYQAIPAALLAQREIMDLFLPTLRADFHLLDTYEHAEQPPLSCPITAFRGQADATVSSQEVRAWDQHTSAAFTMRTLPGGHFFLREHQELLTQAIAGALRRHL